MSSKPIHLPYNQHDAYWLCVLPKEELFDQSLKNTLVTLGFSERNNDDSYFICSAGSKWGDTWQKLNDTIPEAMDSVDIAVIASDAEPEEAQISFSHKSPANINAIYNALWLGDAILNDQMVCHLQPVLAKDERIVGYESFARVVTDDGKTIGGGEIIKSSRELGIEYALDRYLHVLAIKTFMQGGLSGYLFVNFFPGFIQRPEVYLEGLTEAVKMHNMISKQVVLDFTESEGKHDINHLKGVTDFCRSKGYAIALDDVESKDNAEKLVPDIRPDFVKLSRRAISNADKPQNQAVLQEIIKIAHANGSVVIAEGVEDDKTFQSLKEIDVDMYQGYHFSAPVEIKPASPKAASGE